MNVRHRNLSFAGFASVLLALGACTVDTTSPGDGYDLGSVSAALGPADCPMGSNIIMGTSGNDTLDGTAGADCLIGLQGADTLRGGDGNDFYIGGGGNDVIIDTGGSDTAYGEGGNDTFTFSGLGKRRVYGGDGNDTVNGGPDRDILRGELGDDNLSGAGGPDDIHGGQGNDVLRGGSDRDVLRGEAGNDILLGDNTQDTLLGGDGNDVLFGGNSVDSAAGEGGDDDCNAETENTCELDSAVTTCISGIGCGMGQTCNDFAGLCLSCLADTDCDDSDPSTTDSCQPLAGCQNVAGPTNPTFATESTDTTTVDGGAQCPGSPADGEFESYRAFTFSEHGITAPWTIDSVSFGAIATGMGGAQTIKIRIYATDNIGSLGAPVSETTVSLADTTGSVVMFALDSPVLVSGSGFTVGILAPDDDDDSKTFAIGTNAAGQSGPTYVRAPTCGVDAPTNLADAGLPNHHFVMLVNGH